MDPDALRDEVEEWVQDGIITDAQAEEILERYEREGQHRPRAVLVLSLVGLALVFSGVGLFFATNWRDLPVIGRALVLLAGPALAYTGGSLAYDYHVRQVGHALSVLGALLVGPSLFLFDGLFSLGVPAEWLLLAWAAVALPTGHGLRSRPGTALGLALVAAVVAVLSDPADPYPAVGLLGVGVFVLGRIHVRRVSWTYRTSGAAMTVGALLAFTLQVGAFDGYLVGPTPTLLATAIGALVAAGWLFHVEERSAFEWSVMVLAALALATTVTAFAPSTVPELLGFVSVHVAGLAGLVATGYLGYRSRSRALIDLVAVGGLIQTVSFVEATVVTALSGAIALVVAGVVLLAAGVALERGRRSLVSRL